MSKWAGYYKIYNAISLSTGQHYTVVTLAAIIRLYKRISLTRSESDLTFAFMT